MGEGGRGRFERLAIAQATEVTRFVTWRRCTERLSDKYPNRRRGGLSDKIASRGRWHSGARPVRGGRRGGFTGSKSERGLIAAGGRRTLPRGTPEALLPAERR